MLIRNLLLIFLLFVTIPAFSQQDVDFHLSAHLFQGQNILKVKRDFYDPYLWVLAQNDHVYRVNSLTMAVDDYTQKFASYNSLGFVDIAGRSKDTVYVATNSAEVIEYEKGVFRTIDKTSGIDGTINSIGLDYRPAYLYDPFILDIATTTGFYFYNYRTEKITTQTNKKGRNNVFEATYRTLAISDIGDTYYDTTKQYSVYNLTYFTAYGGAVQYNTPAFGDTVNTCYYITNGFPPWINDFDDVDNLTQVWGTEKGLFQNQWNDSYFLWDATVGYLPGIKVNKVTSIFGLLAFSSPGSQFPNKMERENLLVGTQQGLYFTNSYFNKYAGGVHDFNTFTLDADIGSQAVNDICVDVTGYLPALCEDAVWVAAANGLYFLKPDYGAYVNPQYNGAVNFAGQPSALTTLNVCQGDSATAVISPAFYSGNSYQWYKDGQQIPNATKDSLGIKTAGDYYALLYDPCSGLHVQSNHLTVNIISSPVFTFNYPDKIQQCNNLPYTLKTTDNPGYTYRWYTNGAPNGTTTPSFTVTQSGKYKVEVSACTNSWAPSKEVEVDMITLPVPQISSDKSVYCAEDVATLSVNTPADASYAINWYQDGNLLAAKADSASIKVTSGGNYTVTLSSTIGPCTQTSAPLAIAFTPAPVFTFNYPGQLQYCAGTPLTLTVNGSGSYQYQWYRNDTLLTGSTTASIDAMQSGKYKAEVSSCPGSSTSSKAVQVQFVKLEVPVVSVDKANYCVGDVAVVSENIPPDPSYTINWYCNNFAVAGVTNDVSFTTSVPGDYKAVLVYNTQNSDGSFCQQISESKSLVFNPPPTVSIKETVNTTLCAGQTVTLTAQHSAGTAQWSTGELSDQITVTQTGTYKVSVSSPAGCQADTSISVTFLPDPLFSLRDTSICTYKKQALTLTAPAGFVAYSWNNGASTSQTYTVSQPQTVSLTVTDANGCQATQQVKVSEQCADVYIPNTFTPNGDGINDTWVVEGLDETATVKVFTRWGAEVYQSVGYSTPWNGEYSGKKIAPGVYYYIVTAKNGSQKFSGSLTIIY